MRERRNRIISYKKKYCIKLFYYRPYAAEQLFFSFYRFTLKELLVKTSFNCLYQAATLAYVTIFIFLKLRGIVFF